MTYELHENDPYKTVPAKKITVRNFGLPKTVVVRIVK